MSIMEKERLVVVTGSSSGIGEAVANLLAEGGWRVLGIARREGTISHPAYRHHRLDLSDTAAVEAYFLNDFTQAYPARGLERIALVNNAGLLDPMATVPNLPMAALTTAFTVNTVVPMWLMGFFLRTYAGVALRIVNVSSGAANNSRPGWSAYCAAKSALQMAGRVFGDEMESGYPSGIGKNARVLTYEPGLVDTAMQTQIRQTPEEEFPGVGRFIGFFEEAKLQAPGKPASVIRGFLESGPDTLIIKRGQHQHAAHPQLDRMGCGPHRIGQGAACRARHHARRIQAGAHQRVQHVHPFLHGERVGLGVGAEHGQADLLREQPAALRDPLFRVRTIVRLKGCDYRGQHAPQLVSVGHGVFISLNLFGSIFRVSTSRILL